jgi:hypothetical protein
MSRQILVACLAILSAFLHLTANAAAPPKPGGNPTPSQGKEIYVILKARLYEVDEAFYKKVAKFKWRSKADLEELEDKPADDSLFKLLKKQKPALTGKEINVDLGKKGVLLTALKPNNRLPTPDLLRQGKKVPQIINEGFTLSARVDVSADRRFVIAKFLEKSQEIEGIEKVEVVVDLKEGTEATGEIVFVKEVSFSWTRYVPDGGAMLLPLHSRPAAVRKKDRWLVVEITPRIYIEEEERERRAQPPG